MKKFTILALTLLLTLTLSSCNEDNWVVINNNNNDTNELTDTNETKDNEDTAKILEDKFIKWDSEENSDEKDSEDTNEVTDTNETKDNEDSNDENTVVKRTPSESSTDNNSEETTETKTPVWENSPWASDTAITVDAEVQAEVDKVLDNIFGEGADF